MNKKYYHLLGIALFPLVIVGLFFVTKMKTASASELAFIEHSILGKNAGSVLPASCNSTPPTNHFAGDCVANANIGFGDTTSVINTFLSLGISVDTNYLTLGQSATISWQTKGATSCTASGGWSGGKAVNGSQVITNLYQYPFTGYPAIPVETIFTLSCTNGSKNVTKAVRIYFQQDPCAGGGCGA